MATFHKAEIYVTGAGQRRGAGPKTSVARAAARTKRKSPKKVADHRALAPPRTVEAPMSTRTKVHERVPKPTLVNALTEQMQLFRTDELAAAGQTHIEIEVPVTRRQPIRQVTPR